MLFSKGAIYALPAVVNAASAASFPPVPTGLTIVNSTKFPGVSISYKETTICETTKGVKGYSGYVNLPPNAAENRPYSSHMYFWFFEARNDAENAPLSVWLQGGPGVPSITAAVGENGPCSVLSDSKSTELNQWSWNDKVNMLYIDQPVQVGFSYDSLTNGTLDEIVSPFNYQPNNFSTGIPETNLTSLTGTFASKNPFTAPNTTIASTKTIYHFMQAWIQEFPEYKSKDNTFSIWGESYGGHYIPTFADYVEQQSDRIGDDCPETPLHINTVGFINPCIDIDVQMPFYPEFAFNNTYGFKAITEEQYQFAVESTETCRTMSATCKMLADEKDPEGLGNVQEVNQACLGAFVFCFTTMHDNYTTERNVFDIAAPFAPEAFPPKWAAGYLNDAEIQQALGVPLNFTGASAVVATTFNLTGDFVRGHQLANLGTLLDRGVKVALVFGDRDYQCNWMGGEALSLAIESRLSTRFRQAGYTDIYTNDSYIGGLVRQHANLSFSRVFQAGHEVPYYQPQTAFEIFNRVMFGRDVATGMVDAGAEYATVGLSEGWTPSELHLETEEAKCYVWDIFETCTKEQKQILGNGTAVTKGFVLIGMKTGDGEQVLLSSDE